MQLTNKILNILNSITGIKTVLYESGYGTNLRLDRRETPAAILYMLQEYTIDLAKGIKREIVDVEVFICDRCDLAAKGEVVQQKLDTLLPYVNQFVALLTSEKTLLLDGDSINVQMAYGKFDTNVCGYSLQFKASERQGGCIDGDTSGVNKIVITSNGIHNVAAYGEALVNVQGGSIVLQEKTAVANGVVTPDTGYDGLSKVTVQVPTPTPEIRLQEKTANTNGYVTFDNGYDGLQGLTVEANGVYDPLTYSKDGFSTFVVNIPQPQGTLQRTISTNGTQTYDVSLWENIEITTAVPVVPCQLETLNITAAPSQLQPTYTPSGEGFDQVNIDLQLSEKYETYTLQSQFDSVEYDVRDNDYIYINLDASMLPAQCQGNLPVTITNTGIEYVNCCGYDTVSIDTTQIQGTNTWKGTWAQYQAIFPKDPDTL